MAKYNAIYEGRLPQGICNRVICDSEAAAHPRLAGNLLVVIKKGYKKIINILNQETSLSQKSASCQKEKLAVGSRQFAVKPKTFGCATWLVAFKRFRF